MQDSPAISSLRAVALTIPTDGAEADGTLEWDSTTIVIVVARAEGREGIGYSYTDAAAERLVEGALAHQVLGADALAVPGIWQAMRRTVRNLGWAGVAASALAAVDTALWDLKARLLGLPLVDLLGTVRDEVPVYGSGGFTSYPPHRLAEQLAGWAAAGIGAVKMKVGARPDEDVARVAAAREAIGQAAALMVDANGAYDRALAGGMARAFGELGVVWFEEPVSSDDVAGLRHLRRCAPAGMALAAGEYAYDLFAVRRLLEGDAVDVLQLDATRCGGITGFLRAAALAGAHAVPISAHTAPSLHLHPCCALPDVKHVEYFHDHARIEAMLFDGAARPTGGVISPDRSRTGNGLALRGEAAERLAA